MLKLTGASLFAVSLTFPAMAQNTAAPSTINAPGAPAAQTPSVNASSTSARNAVTTDSSGIRVTKIVGSPVYNDHDEKIGSVDDLLVGNDHSLHVILSVGGFLGIGSKMVEVPYDKLRFGNAAGNTDNRIVLPGSSKQDLTSMPDFEYTNRG